MTLVFAHIGFTQSAGAKRELQRLKFCFTTNIFNQIGANDARASMKSWGQAVAGEIGSNLDVQTQTVDDAESLAKKFRNKEVEGGIMPIDDFFRVESTAPFGKLLITETQGGHTDQYVLLVHAESNARKLADLKGARINRLNTYRMCLADDWINGILAEQVATPANKFFDSVVPCPKLSRAVLPVFFQQVDACVVTVSGFNTMAELNPQIGRQLRTLATSEPLVTAALLLRKDNPNNLNQSAIRALERMHLTPSGQQILTLFQSDRIRRHPLSALDTARKIANKRIQLRRASHGGASIAP